MPFRYPRIVCAVLGLFLLAIPLWAQLVPVNFTGYWGIAGAASCCPILRLWAVGQPPCCSSYHTAPWQLRSKTSRPVNGLVTGDLLGNDQIDGEHNQREEVCHIHILLLSNSAESRFFAASTWRTIVPKNLCKNGNRRGPVFSSLGRRNYRTKNQLFIDTISLDFRNQRRKLGP